MLQKKGGFCPNFKALRFYDQFLILLDKQKPDFLIYFNTHGN